jgi:hypothetical protein
MDNERRGRFTGIYLRMDGIRRTLALRLAHYGDAGALSEDQIYWLSAVIWTSLSPRIYRFFLAMPSTWTRRWGLSASHL